MAKIRVKPKEGVTVKDHLGRVIDPEGQSVCDNHIIRRLIKDGDLFRAEAPKQVVKSKKDKS